MEFVGLTGYAESATPEQLLDKYGMLARDVAVVAWWVFVRKFK